MESVFLFHFRSLDMVVPRNSGDSTVEGTEPLLLRGLVRRVVSTAVSNVFYVLSSRWLLLHQETSCSTSFLWTDSSPLAIRPITVVSSANFKAFLTFYLLKSPLASCSLTARWVDPLCPTIVCSLNLYLYNLYFVYNKKNT